MTAPPYGDHPRRAFAVIIAMALTAYLLSVAAVWAMATLHVLSPNNVVAGALIGLGGTMLGFIAGFLVVLHKDWL